MMWKVYNIPRCKVNRQRKVRMPEDGTRGILRGKEYLGKIRKEREE